MIKASAYALCVIAGGIFVLFLIESLFPWIGSAQFAKDISTTAALASIAISLAIKKS